MAHHTCFLSRQSDVSSSFSFGACSVQTRFEVISKFEENAVYSTNLKLISLIKIYTLCYIHIRASPGLIRGIIQFFISQFEEFSVYLSLRRVVGESSCVVPAAFLLLIRSVFFPRFTLHLILLSRVTRSVCRREEIRRKE